MKILFVEPGKEAQPAEIQGALKEMQAIVGGQIQALYPWEDSVALICNDEGKLLRLPLNRALEDYDMIAGNFFICGIEGDAFVSLSDPLMIKYQEKFHGPVRAEMLRADIPANSGGIKTPSRKAEG